MLEIHLRNISLFKLAIDSIKELTVECNFEFSDLGITLQTMDVSHTALISLCLFSDFFDIYKCDENVVLGINLTILNKCLKFILISLLVQKIIRYIIIFFYYCQAKR